MCFKKHSTMGHRLDDFLKYRTRRVWCWGKSLIARSVRFHKICSSFHFTWREASSSIDTSITFLSDPACGEEWRRKIDLLYVPFSFRNYFLHPDFEMFFNYLSSTNRQMVWDFPKMKQHFQRGLTIYNREDSARDIFWKLELEPTTNSHTRLEYSESALIFSHERYYSSPFSCTNR